MLSLKHWVSKTAKNVGRKLHIFLLNQKLRKIAHVSEQLVDISKLGLNSKIKKFSYSFICGKGYSPPFRGRIAFCLQSDRSCERSFRALQNCGTVRLHGRPKLFDNVNKPKIKRLQELDKMLWEFLSNLLKMNYNISIM